MPPFVHKVLIHGLIMVRNTCMMAIGYFTEEGARIISQNIETL